MPGPRVNIRYQRRSLLWVRELLGKDVPRFPSAYSMANRYQHRLVRTPEIGMVCFFGDTEPGDCGLYLGRGLVRMLDTNGWAYTLPLSEVRSTFIGAMHWPAVPDKVGETA